jgi:hypothetical protein
VAVASRVDVVADRTEAHVTLTIPCHTPAMSSLPKKAFKLLRTVEEFKNGTLGMREMGGAMMGEMIKQAPVKPEPVEDEKRDAQP